MLWLHDRVNKVVFLNIEHIWLPHIDISICYMDIHIILVLLSRLQCLLLGIISINACYHLSVHISLLLCACQRIGVLVCRHLYLLYLFNIRWGELGWLFTVCCHLKFSHLAWRKIYDLWGLFAIRSMKYHDLRRLFTTNGWLKTFMVEWKLLLNIIIVVLKAIHITESKDFFWWWLRFWLFCVN